MLKGMLIIISAIMAIVELGITIIVTPFLVLFMVCLIIIEGAIKKN